MVGVAKRKIAARQDADAGYRQPRHQPRRTPATRRPPHPAYAGIVGRENVIAGTDCGLGGRVHADLAWAKLRTLAEGARLASKSLWPG